MQRIAPFAQPSYCAWQVESSSEEDESDDEDVVVAAPAANGKKVSTAAQGLLSDMHVSRRQLGRPPSISLAIAGRAGNSN